MNNKQVEIRWKCSHCARRYSTDEMLALPEVKAVDDDPDPTGPTGYGYIAVCKCGKVFHRDKWRLQEDVAGLDGKPYWVSTVHLELNHGSILSPDKRLELWYETMIKGPDDKFLVYQDRYTTQAEAEAGHLLAVSQVRSGLIHSKEEI